MRRPSDPGAGGSADGPERDTVAVREELDAIDAVLAGRAVEPRFAELAELTLLLHDDRPQLPEGRARSLDARILGGPQAAPVGGLLVSRWMPWLGALRPASRRAGTLALVGCALAGLLAVVLILSVGVGVGGGGGGTSRSASSGSAPVVRAPASAAGAGAGSSSSAASGASGQAYSPSKHGTGAGVLGRFGPPPAVKSPSARGFGASTTSAAGAATDSPVPAPLPNGRRLVSSAQLQLATPAGRIDAVAQEVFTVVGAEKGIVENSSVVSGSGAGATFTLSIPSANLTSTLTRLSSLSGARVASRTDGSQDVNDTYLADQRRLSEAQALRTSLLRQLAAATTTAEIDSLQAQIHDADATIGSNESALGSLNRQIAYSALSVQIEPGAAVTVTPGPGGHRRGFTLARAGHDALRVLVVTVGVLLIALAVLVPVGLLVLVGARVVTVARRRRREAALDAV